MKKILFKKTIQNTLVLLLVVAIALPATILSIPPKKAEAAATSCAAGFVTAVLQSLGDIAKSIANVPTHPSSTDTAQTESHGAERAKYIMDCIEGPIAIAIARAILARMTDSIVKWINGGFNGKPAFITNPKSFFLNVGDQIAGDLILGSDLAFLCSPFQAQVRIALALNYASSYSEKAACTLSQIFSNVDNAFDDFNNGGWAGWISITQNTSNNPYGSYLEASAEQDSRIAAAQNVQLTQLNWNSGFLSQKTCTERVTDPTTGKTTLKDVPDPSTDPNYDPVDRIIDCETNTPGQVIYGTLQNTLNLPEDQIGFADDLDKIFNALGEQLVNQVITKGLSSLTQSSSQGGGGGSFLDQLASSTATSAGNEKQTGQTNLDNLNNPTLPDDGSTPTTPTSSTQQNVAINKTVYASGIQNNLQLMVDGDKSNTNNQDYGGALTDEALATPSKLWVSIDLGATIPIDHIIIYQRVNPSPKSTAVHFNAQILDENNTVVWTSPLLYQNFGNPINIDVPAGITGKWVKFIGNDPTVSARLEFAEIEVYQNNPPAITLKGGNPMTVTQNATFTDPGASAVDDGDGNVSSGIAAIGTVDTSTLGTYTITYFVTDSKGATGTAKRTVNVVATTQFPTF